MKFLQLNTNSFNTSLEELWLHHLENNYDGLFLQETNHKNGCSLGNFKNWKVKMHTTFDQKTLGYGVGTLFPPSVKSVFREDLLRDDLEMAWSEIFIEGQKVLIGNIYVPPKEITQLYVLDEVLEKLENKNLILVGDFNARNTMWDSNCKNNTKLGVYLENIIQRHGLYIATNTNYTYHHSEIFDNSGKSTIDLTLTRGIKNINIQTFNIEEIKTRHKAIIITVGEQTNLKCSKTSHFKTKNANWDQWQNFLENNLIKHFVSSYPKEISETIIDKQACLLTEVIVESAKHFFGMTEISTKESKGWWNNNIKMARNEVKESLKKYKKIQSPFNHNDYLNKKQTLQVLIKNSKFNLYKKTSDYLNQSKDANQFWHRYEKVLKTKRDNVIEPMYDETTKEFIFEDELISNILYNHHIKINKTNMEYDKNFEKDVNFKVKNILSSISLSSEEVFFEEIHVKEAIRDLNKNSSPGPDRITPELIQNGGDFLITCITSLLQDCYLLGYFPKCWKQDNKIYIKKPDKDSYNIPNSYRPVSLSNILGKIYEKIILQKTVNLLTQEKFFDGKNVYAYQKNKNAPQALLPLIEQMMEAISNGKYGIVVMADLQGAFDAVWRNGALYKLHNAGIRNNLLSVFSSFLNDRFSRNLVNSHTSEWFLTQRGVPQGSILSAVLFLIFTADLTMEDFFLNWSNVRLQTTPRESKYADDVEFWRIHSDFYRLLIDTQIAIVSLQEWCSKWQISVNILKTTYMIFYDKKKMPAPSSIPLTINGKPLKRVFTQRILGIIIDSNLCFSPHIENITIKCKKAYNRLTLFPDLRPDLAIQIYKSFIRSKLEYGSAVWGHTLYNNKHLKLLEAAQRGALMLILRSMKSSPLDAMEAELCISPIDLRLQELQRNEAIKLLQKNDKYISDNMEKINKGNKPTPLIHLGHMVKQVLNNISKTLKINTHQIKIPKEIPPSFETFFIPTMTTILPNKFSSDDEIKTYIKNILDPITDDTMVIFTDGSAQGNPGPVGSGVVIKMKGVLSTPIKLAKAITSHGSCYEGEIAAIKLGTDFAINNIGSANKLYIYSDSQSAIKSIIRQDRESFHDETIYQIRLNLIELSFRFDQIKLIYCPAHKGINENEMADSLAKVAAKKATHLQTKSDLSQSDIQSANKQVTINKWARRWENSKFNKYKEIVPAICKNSLKNRMRQIKYTTRKSVSKIFRLKSGHSMLNGHKSKIVLETSPLCDVCKKKETPVHYLLECTKYMKERNIFLNNISSTLSKNNIVPINVTFETLLGEQNFSNEDSKIIREELQKFIISTRQDF